MRKRIATSVVTALLLLLAGAGVRADVLPLAHAVVSPTPAAVKNTKFDSVKGWGPLTFSMTIDEARAALIAAKITPSGTGDDLAFKSPDGYITVKSRTEGKRTLVTRLLVGNQVWGEQTSEKDWLALLARLKEQYGEPEQAQGEYEQVYVWKNKAAKLEVIVSRRHEFFQVKQRWTRPDDAGPRDMY